MTRRTRSFSLFLSSPLTIFILISFIEIYLPPVLLKPPEWQLLFSGSPQPIYSPDNEVQAVYLLLCFPAFGSQIFHLKKACQRRLHAKDWNPGLHGGFLPPAGLAALPIRASISGEMLPRYPRALEDASPHPLHAASCTESRFIAVRRLLRRHGWLPLGCLHASDNLGVTGDKRRSIKAFVCKRRFREINI